MELRDYRDLAGEQFDHIVSIEMLEAVGERWWPTTSPPCNGCWHRRAGDGAEHHDS
jgi:hypothetical protein